MPPTIHLKNFPIPINLSAGAHHPPVLIILKGLVRSLTAWPASFTQTLSDHGSDFLPEGECEHAIAGVQESFEALWSPVLFEPVVGGHVW